MAGKNDSAKGDVKLVTNLLMNKVFGDKDNILQYIQQNQNDPVNALAHAIFIEMVHARQALAKAQLPIDGRVWIAKGGVLDNVVMQVAQMLVSAFGKQFGDPKMLQAVKQAIMDLMNQHEQAGGGSGMPAPAEAPNPDGGEDDGAGGGLVAPMQGEI